MIAALERGIGENVTWSFPEGGYFLWVDLPEAEDAAVLLRRSTEAGVTFVKGADFFPNGGGESSLRLAFSYETPERIIEGIALLGDLLATG